MNMKNKGLISTASMLLTAVSLGGCGETKPQEMNKKVAEIAKETALTPVEKAKEEKVAEIAKETELTPVEKAKENYEVAKKNREEATKIEGEAKTKLITETTNASKIAGEQKTKFDSLKTEVEQVT